MKFGMLNMFERKLKAEFVYISNAKVRFRPVSGLFGQNCKPNGLEISRICQTANRTAGSGPVGFAVQTQFEKVDMCLNCSISYSTHVQKTFYSILLNRKVQ